MVAAKRRDLESGEPRMFDAHEPSRVAHSHGGPPGVLASGAASPNALQILTTEHWSLLASRSLGYTEAMSRAAIFVAALSGTVVALALVAQATDFGDGFVAFSLVLLPVVYFLGAATIIRLGQINSEDAVWVQGMNRLRHAYLELAPELEPYFVTSPYDDERGLMLSSLAMRKTPPPLQAFVAIPGVVAVLDSVVAGATFGIAGLGLDLGTPASVLIGGAAFVVALGVFMLYAVRTIHRYRRSLVIRFPTPPD
jgi:hypothetical protein